MATPYVNTSGTDEPHGTDIEPTTVNADGTQTKAIVAASAAAAVKPGPGRLCRLLVTTAGTAQLTFYDNTNAASGTIIGIVPANATVGQVFDVHMPALTGIYCGGGASTPAVTVSYC